MAMRPRPDPLDNAAAAVTVAMAAFDVALGLATIARPAATLRRLGHDAPSPDAEALFRRCGPIWLTFAAAHAVAAARGHREDWHALAWLRSTELATDVLWSGSGFFASRRARMLLRGAGAGNLALTALFAARARH